MSNDIALRRMERGGVTLTSTGQLIAELTSGPRPKAASW
jgi:hypothetical protein